MAYSENSTVLEYMELQYTVFVWNRFQCELIDILCSAFIEFHPFMLKGQMHLHDDLGSKCAYTCHLSNKTTLKSVLLSTPQIWLMKVSKKLA